MTDQPRPDDDMCEPVDLTPSGDRAGHAALRPPVMLDTEIRSNLRARYGAEYPFDAIDALTAIVDLCDYCDHTRDRYGLIHGPSTMAIRRTIARHVLGADTVQELVDKQRGPR